MAGGWSRKTGARQALAAAYRLWPNTDLMIGMLGAWLRR